MNASTPRWLVLPLLSFLSTFACSSGTEGSDSGSDATDLPECGEHGELHGDHCHCDDGFVERNGTCVAASPAEGDCGEHGHLHDDECHCDDGYIEQEGTCVAAPPAEDDCGEHGHFHDGECHCDDDFVEQEGTCVAAPPAEDDCGEHGELHGDECHCDDGYALVEGTCVEDTPQIDCGPHGELHGDHCHCDDGYVEVEQTCQIDCGPHGDRVDGVCACDDGYVLSEGTCVEEPPECGGHGHLHGDHCHCDAGYVPADGTCVEEPIVVPPPVDLSYRVTRIGYPDKTSYALALNDAKQVTGNTLSEAPGAEGKLRAFLWTPPSGAEPARFEELGKLPYIGASGSDTQFSRGYDLNASGVVVGESDNSFSQAFRWEDGLLTAAGSLNAQGTGVALGINDAGVIIGASSNGSSSRGFRFDGGVASDLGSLDGLTTTTSRATAINHAGDVVGYSRNDDNVTRATLWRANGSIWNLGYLAPGQLSWAFDLNSRRQVVGSAIVSGSTYHAFFWEDGVIRDLGVLPSLPAAIHSEALALNDSGWAVGYVASLYNYVTLGTAAAVLWIDGQIYDLNELLPEGSGWQLLSAQDINSNGDIVGYGRYEGVTSAFLLERELVAP